MVTEIYTNQPSTTVTVGGTGATTGSETWTVSSSAGWPAAATGVSQFHIADTALPTELITVTNVSGTTWTVTRAAESTSSVAHTAGFTVQQVITAGGMNGLLPLAGGTMTGPVAMGASKITGLGNGSSAQDAAAFGQIPVIDTTAGHIQPVGTSASAGNQGLVADSKHQHSWGQAAPAGFTPANPSSTTSTSLVMMGLGSTCTYTPAGSGIVLVNVTGFGATATAVAQIGVGGRYGTGTAPSNGAAVTGTRFGGIGDGQIRPSAPATSEGFALTALLTLTPSTAYWFDVAISTSAGADAASITSVSMTLVELP